MARRDFSMVEYFNRVARDWQPLLSFRGRTPEDFAAWRAEAHAKLFELLGDWPERVDPEPEVLYRLEEDGLVRERVVFDVDPHMSLPAVVMRPADMPEDGSGAAILCSHGHGPFGKESVAGNATTPARAENIRVHNYDYACQMARAGYLTLSPDLRVFGERSDGGNPWPGRDPCNINFIRGAILGIYTLTLNLWDMMRCVDYLQSRPEVNPERIGMMGLSQGGTMTTFTTAAEPRIKCADIMGYLNPWERFGVQKANFCGSQIVPGIFKWFDTHDIAGLIAPRPLLVEIGVHDTCFPVEDQLISWERIKAIYEAAGAGEDCWRDLHPGEHGFSGRRAFDFFARYL